MNLKSIAASVAAASLLAPSVAAAATPFRAPAPAVRGVGPETSAIVAALRNQVKYVFVLFQENRSFDSYFGTFPGAEGLYSAPPGATPGFVQNYLDTNGNTVQISPFRIPVTSPYYAADTDDVDHSHPRLVAKMDVQSGTPRMDQFASVEEAKYTTPGMPPSLEAKQFGELSMAYEDCDTIPLLWNYANRFVLFDHVFQSVTGPSTPGNISIIAAQSGLTQWVEHPNEAYTGNGGSGTGVPVLNDDDPLWGSQLDPNPPALRLPVNPNDFSGGVEYGTQINLTFASLPLTLAGSDIGKTIKSDRDPAGDLGDVVDDVLNISNSAQAPVPWGWYEEGYGHEPTDPAGQATHLSYVTHHNGPQYFGYVSNNPAESRNLHGLSEFFNAVTKGTLPAGGGAYYVKGGFQNIFHLSPSDPDPTVQKNFLGDDDHPGYSDAQISEANVAEAINRIAASKYWSQSAIIVTWDDSEGDYDHVPPLIRTVGPNGEYISDGPRVPLLVISPFAKTHVVAHEQGDHGSVVKFIDTVFGRTPLAKLPNELRARKLGEKQFGEANLGPDDAFTPGIGDLVEAFDPARLLGTKAPLDPAYATVPESYIRKLPLQSGLNCNAIGVIPVDRMRGISAPPPADFNPRPKTNPGPGLGG